jgi:predicted alpha/beta hydrolase family esterase
MKFSFFKALAVAIFSGHGKKPVGHELGQLHRELMRKPKLQVVAQEHGNQRRIDAWLRSVRGGYEAKAKLVAASKGCNTLAGIPA